MTVLLFVLQRTGGRVIISVGALGKPKMRNTHQSRRLRRKKKWVSAGALGKPGMRNKNRSGRSSQWVPSVSQK